MRLKVIKRSGEPYALNVPREVHLPLLDEAKKKLDKLHVMGVISWAHRHTSWCAQWLLSQNPMVKSEFALTLPN